MKKIFTILIALSLLLSLGACSLLGLGKTTTPATENTPATNETTVPKENPNIPKNHTITITDEEGNGIANIAVMISTDSDASVGGGATDENGTLSLELIKDKEYIITLMAVPDKYEVEESYAFTDLEANIVLKTAE